MAKNWFTVKKLYPNIWGIAEFAHSEEVISYLFVGKNKCLLIDSGLGIANINEEIKKITNLPVSLINTHSHYDHIGGNKLFKKINYKKEIKLDPFLFEIIKTPGHSPDSICLFEITNKILISGDTLYPAPIYLHLKESDVDDYINSLKKLIVIPELKNILPGHDDFKMNKNIIGKILKALETSDRIKNLKIDNQTSIRFK